MKKTIVLYLILSLTKIVAQDTSKIKTNPFSLSAYLDIYYCYDFGEPSNHVRPSFFYSYNRHNEVNLNLGMIKAAYNTENVRGNLALMAGTYAQYNLAREQEMLRYIFEANIGFKISTKKNVWIDAGIMLSHIGFESAIGKDCWTVTRSILADNSPYFETGVKLGFTSKNEKLYMAAMYLNGWQNIQRNPYNQTPAFGTQLTFKPNGKTALNWSTFVGNSSPDSAKNWRYFNNFYGQFQISSKIGVIAGFDIGIQQHRDSLNVLKGLSTWYAPIIIMRYALTPKTYIAARAEYYADEKNVIIADGSPNGFRTFGYSLNFDYFIHKNILWRIEGRALQSDDKIFTLNKKPSNQNFFITTSLNISF